MRSHLVGNDPRPRPNSPLGQRLYDVDELRATAEEVISNERGILGHRSLAEAASILETLRPQAPGASVDDYRLWLRAMLLSSRRIYQSNAGWTEFQAGEQFELRAIGELLRSDSRDQLDRSAWKELVALVPTAEEREQWRRNFLLRAWLSYQRDPEYLPFFFHSGAGELRRLIPAERWRTERLLDRAIRISLEQLDEGLPPQSSPEEAKRLQAWSALRDDEFLGADYPFSYLTEPLPTSNWTQDLEQHAERLRAMGK